MIGRSIQGVGAGTVFLALFLSGGVAAAVECDQPVSDYAVAHSATSQGDESLDQDSFFTKESNLRNVVSMYPQGTPPEGGFPLVLSLSLGVGAKSAEDYFCIPTKAYCDEDGQFCYSGRYRNQIFKSLVELGYAVVAPAAWAPDSWFYSPPPPTPPLAGECCGSGRYLKSLTVPAIFGASTIEVNSDHGIEFKDGRLKHPYIIRVALDSGVDYRRLTAASGTTLTLDSPLTGAASQGNEVQMLDKSDCECSWPGADEAFLRVFFDDLEAGNFGPLNSDSVQMMGWSDGAQMTSRCMNNFPFLYTKADVPFPEIERAMLLGGGSYECYSERFAPNCLPSFPFTNCCPTDTTEENFGDSPDAPLSWAEHPPVLSCQAEPDHNADPRTAELYTNVMKEHDVPAKKVVLNLTDEGCQEHFGVPLSKCAGHFFFPEMQQPTVSWLSVPEPSGLLSHVLALAALLALAAKRRVASRFKIPSDR